MTDPEGRGELVEGPVEDLVRRIVDQLVRDGDVAGAFRFAMEGEAAIAALLAELWPPGPDRREPTEE
jgi:hypothetical protein